MSVWGTGLLKGLKISMTNMLRKPITVQYPHEQAPRFERARWRITATYDRDGEVKCTACMACVRACPDHVLDLTMSALEDGTKHIDSFSYEIGACMFCGLCVDACPFSAIEHTGDFEMAKNSAEDLTYDLIADVDAASPRKNRPAPPPKPASEAAAADSAVADTPAGDAAVTEDVGGEDA